MSSEADGPSGHNIPYRGVNIRHNAVRDVKHIKMYAGVFLQVIGIN